ncbi:MAG: M20/M25/M40 family metallo-hydrolase [Prevotellaceae bacterium]|jgi:acetylornithine deacetylase|nr:M20/M25/M40 family metallo-hydrolase [Prevotellaceae bacterium]
MLEDALYRHAVALLKGKIAVPALSGDEKAAAGYLCAQLAAAGLSPFRVGNNVCVWSQRNRDGRQTLMLNSHIDTVGAASGYTRNPFDPLERDGRLYGLGSNDAGASLVAMIAVFRYFNTVDLPFNLLLALSCEEETSGEGGIEAVLRTLPATVDCAIVGEPTGMKAAVGERGLLVVDGTARGVGGHAARDEGVNAIDVAMQDIDRIRRYPFTRVSPLMGAVKTSVTVIHGGMQHNVIPDRCTFVVDIRPNECYTNCEILSLLQAAVQSDLQARSLTHRCSFTPDGHPLRVAAERLGIDCFISPTTSDWVRLPMPAIKMGPGDSARSHSADEFVYLHEIDDGIRGYIRFITNLQL